MSLSETAIAQRDAMLTELPDTWDKTDGSIFWNIVSALSVPLGDEIDRLDEELQLRDPAKMTGDELETFCRRYGVYRNPAVESTAVLQITLDEESKTADIADGTLFETEDGVQFAASQDYGSLSDGDVIDVHAVVAGAHGNVEADTITVIPVTVEGVASVTNPSAGTGGQDEEDDIDLFERWQIKVSYRITGYNKGWYEALALEQSDIGYARCYAAGESISDTETVPHGSVYLVVLDDNRQPLSDDRLAEIQEMFDPEPQSTGLGLTPATAYCYVKNGAAKELEVTLTGVLQTGDVSNMSKLMQNGQSVTAKIAGVLIELFENTAINSTIYGAQLFSAAMAVDEVISIGSLTIDGELRTSLAYNEIPVLSKLTCGITNSVADVETDTDIEWTPDVTWG